MLSHLLSLSRSFICRAFVFALCLNLLSGLCAQTTKGKEFWFGFLKNSYNNADLEVYICASDLPAIGTVSMPAIGWSQGFSVSANATTSVVIPYAQALPLSTGIEDMAIFLSSDVDVHVYAINYLTMTADASIVLPTTGLGSEYIITSYDPTLTMGSQFSEFNVVATENNTVVNITPTAQINGGGAAGSTYTITLDQGQLYQGQSYGDITGTYIEVDPSAQGTKPVAVFAGDESVSVGGCTYNDHLYDAMLPVSTWGKEYIGVPFKNKLGDEFIIVASENGTIVDVGGNIQNLDMGDSYLYFADTTHFICSNKDISFTQFCRGFSCDGMEGDPLMIVNSSLDQPLNTINFNAFTSSVITDYYVNVVCVNSATSDLYLDGVDISSQLIPLSSNTAYSYAKVDITSGNHKLTSNNGLLASVYGFGGKESYGYSAGYSLNNAVTDDYEVSGSTTKLCTGETLQFNEELASEVIGVEWELGDQTTSTELNPQKTYDAAGTYEVKMIVERRCRKDTIIKTIEVEDCIEEALWVPTAFSPNNDGINDLLYVRGLANDPFLFRVYNRYGQVVFETEDLSLGWDGRINGKIISSATFMYTLQGTVNDEAYFKKGNITLVK